MPHLIKRELIASWKALLFWTLGLLLFGAIGFYEYGALLGAQGGVTALFDRMPRILKVTFGFGSLPITSPEGYYACMFLYSCCFAYTHAALLGASLLIKEERGRTVDFLFTRPMTRTRILAGKLLSGVLMVLWISAVTWGSSLMFYLPQLEDTAFAADIHLTTIGMLLTQLLFLFAGFFFAAVLKNAKRAPQVAALLVLGSFLLSVLLELSEPPAWADLFSPFRFFSAAGVLTGGVRPLFAVVTVLLLAVFGVSAFRAYGRRDLVY